MAGIITYIKESFEELKNNVTWPTWAEAQRLTVIVAVFSIIFSLVIWGLDIYFSELITGDLFKASTYSEYLKTGFFGVLRIVWFVLLTGGIFYGLSSFLSKNK
ncbi:preprotein translocase subunit SecE [Hyunsoonleella sp. 2307UL5-6]|uniref:preprotein translocase subunit SecE n=1 Tax=Hyunsoonleella sp. 2307UL5-6 TaxID=3384768 RepID=UPI0039BD2CEE